MRRRSQEHLPHVWQEVESAWEAHERIEEVSGGLYGATKSTRGFLRGQQDTGDMSGDCICTFCVTEAQETCQEVAQAQNEVWLRFGVAQEGLGAPGAMPGGAAGVLGTCQRVADAQEAVMGKQQQRLHVRAAIKHDGCQEGVGHRRAVSWH